MDESSMTSEGLKVRPMVESDLEEADRIVRRAFGTFRGLPDPEQFMGDAAYVCSRWTASPESAFVAEVDGKLVGSNFATRWGSFGFFGPLTLDPEFWGRGFASALIEPVIDLFKSWGVTHSGLFTFVESPKHISLYQKFGFRPRALTLILEKDLTTVGGGTEGWTTYSQLDEKQRSEVLVGSRTLTDGIYPGLDVSSEVLAIQNQSLGDTVLITSTDLVGLATCHIGSGSEAGSGVCKVKFGAAKSGSGARGHFRRLLESVEAFAAGGHASNIVAGVNAARREAYEEMISAGYRISFTGLAMHRPNEPGFSRPGAFVIDDWR